MITNLYLENYKNFKELDLKMKNLNVLIGANTTGKSNFLRLFVLFNEGANQRFSEYINFLGGFNGIVYNFREQNDIIIDFEFVRREMIIETINGEKRRIIEHIRYSYNVILSSIVFGFEKSETLTRIETDILSTEEQFIKIVNRKMNLVSQKYFDNGNVDDLNNSIPIKNNEELIVAQLTERSNICRYFTDYFKNINFYKNFDLSLNSNIRKVQMVKSMYSLNSDGSNLINVLHTIYSQETEYWERIENSLRAAFPNFKRIVFSGTPAEGQIDLKWENKSSEPVSAYFLSDGQLKFLCLLALMYNPFENGLILIDEPETCLHTSLHRIIGELFKEASLEKQIIIATHSPDIINALEPEDVIVFNYDTKTDSTKAERLDSEVLTKWLEDYRLGELWEMGEIGGK